MENDSTHISDNDESASVPHAQKVTTEGRGAHSPQATTANDPDTLIGRKLGNFEVLSMLGRGGFGAVYKAQDTKLGRFVAIKFLHNPLDETRRKLFEREARALAVLSKEAAIVGVYEWGEIGAQSYIVLEFVDGSTESLLKEYSNGLPVARALGISADCAEALHSAHAAGILHRDIKPPNILVELSTGRAKVADFGLARLAEESGEFTLAGGLSGSPPYMSPEQASIGELDGRSDIFSLGVTLYELLCGERPFVGASSGQVMEKIRRNDRIPLRERRPGLPSAIFKIVDKATAHNPKDRYQTAGEFAADLRATLGALDETELADTCSAHRVRPFSARRRIAIMLSALAVAVVGVLLWRFVVTTMVPPSGTERSDPRTDSTGSESEAGVVLAAVKAALESLDLDASPENRLVVASYLKEIARRTREDSDERVLASAQRLGETLKDETSAKVDWDGWTSRRLSFFLLATERTGSKYVAQQGLEDILDAALDTTYAGITSMDYLNRDNLDLITRELELSSNLSNEERGLAMGQFVGARLMVGVSIRALGSAAPEKLYLNITDIEKSTRIPVPAIAVEDFTSPESLLDSVAKSIRQAAARAYPPQGRLYRDGDQARINIGEDVGVVEGSVFEVRREPSQRPISDAIVTVVGPPGAGSSEVTASGPWADELPDSAQSGWYVREVTGQSAD